MAMGGDSCSKGCGFESQQQILDGHFFTFKCSKNCNVCLKRTENKQKEVGDGLIKTYYYAGNLGRLIAKHFISRHERDYDCNCDEKKNHTPEEISLKILEQKVYKDRKASKDGNVVVEDIDVSKFLDDVRAEDEKWGVKRLNVDQIKGNAIQQILILNDAQV